MKTLSDYVKGYPNVPISLLARYRDKDNNKYYLCKEPGHNNFYILKGEEVLDRKYISQDHLEKLSIQFLNHPHDAELLEKIKEQQSYKYFASFIKKEFGEEYVFRP